MKVYIVMYNNGAEYAEDQEEWIDKVFLHQSMALSYAEKKNITAPFSPSMSKEEFDKVSYRYPLDSYKEFVEMEQREYNRYRSGKYNVKEFDIVLD